jgi:BASS family bile acid:Na+ symporter
MREDRLTGAFPLLALGLSALALALPQPFTAAREAIVPLLMVVMLGMGLTLDVDDFAVVARRPTLLLLGAGLQFTVMPLAALAIAKLVRLDAEVTAGLVLVGAASGGTASNVITYLARGNLALSVALTLLSTLLAVALMPLITLGLVGRSVPVPVLEMLVTVAQIGAGPVILGMVLRRLLARTITRVEPALPAVSVLAICLIIAIIVALNRGNLADAGPAVAVAVVLHNATGLAAGYLCARLLGIAEREARTLAIEVGMQNSGLAVALAIKFFAPVAALPGALFSVWHNVSGSLLASFWARRSAGLRPEGAR